MNEAQLLDLTGPKLVHVSLALNLLRFRLRFPQREICLPSRRYLAQIVWVIRYLNVYFLHVDREIFSMSMRFRDCWVFGRLGTMSQIQANTDNNQCRNNTLFSLDINQLVANVLMQLTLIWPIEFPITAPACVFSRKSTSKVIVEAQ